MNEETQPGAGSDPERAKEPQKTDEEWSAEIQNDLRTNERYGIFFDQYHPSSLNDMFIKSYADEKVRVLKHARKCLANAEGEELSISKRGADCMWQIQQRKLFDLQCKWRAREIELPDVHTTIDFHYWGELIQRCPFLTPITQEEFDLYHNYMLSEDFDEQRLYGDWLWQDYNILKMRSDDDEEDDEYPPWYTFYEAFKGRRDWRLLPNIRGEEEDRYWNILRPPTQTPAEPEDHRPYIGPWDDDTRDDFRKRFETPEYLRLFEAYDKAEDWRYYEERLRMAIWEFLEFDGPLPMEYNDDWKEAIFEAAERATNLRLVQACEAAYKEYQTREELGLQHEILLDEKRIKGEEERRAHFMEEMRKAKILNGEKPDF